MTRILALSLITLTTVALPVSGQIDYRVNHQQAGSDGRLLDRNPLVGSGGVNSPAAYPVPGAASNAIITGNVTGLSRFHGSTPIVDTNRFRADLPSAGLSNFQAETVNLGQVLSGQTFRPSYYYGRAETISDLGFIRSGLNVPGSSSVQSTIAPRPTALNPAPFDSMLIHPSSNDTRLQNNIQPFNPMMRQIPLTNNLTGSQSNSIYNSAAGSSIFGAPPPSATLYSPTAAYATMEEMREKPVSNALVPIAQNKIIPEGADTATPDQAGFSTSLSPLYSTESSQVRPNEQQLGPDLVSTPGISASGSLRQQLEPQPTKLDPGVTAKTPSQPTGLLVPLRPEGSTLSRSTKDSSLMDSTLRPSVAASVREPPTPGDLPESKRKPTVAETTRGIQEMAMAVDWRADTKGQPLRSFSDKYQGSMKDYVEAAEKALHAGQFYNAARWFDLASAIDAEDPLSYLGRGHSLLAAGDYLSAFTSIRRGIEKFPDIADHELDLPSLIGRHDIFDIRRSDLEQRLAKGEHYEFRFLLGYLQIYSGLAEEGMRNLEEAAKGAPAHSIINRFPTMLLKRGETSSSSPVGK